MAESNFWKDIFLPARKTVKFSPRHPILVSGDIKGDIKAYRIFGNKDFLWKNS